MADQPSQFVVLLQQARSGDRESLLELTRKYEPEVRIVARVLLGPSLRPYLDSLDVVQSVHRSLLMGLRAEKFDITSPEQLVGLALTMVRRKVARRWRQVRRQQRLDRAANTPENLADLLSSLVSAEPDPARNAQINEAIRRLCARLSGIDRQLMELRLQGHSNVEIARQLGVDADVLRVRLSRLRQELRETGLMEEWLA